MPQRAPLPPDFVARLERLDPQLPEHDLVQQQQLCALITLISSKEPSVGKHR